MEIDFSDFADPKNNNLEIKNPPQNVDGLVLQKKLRKSTFSKINDPNQKIELLRQSGQSGFLPLNKQLSELKNEEKNFHVRNEINDHSSLCIEYLMIKWSLPWTLVMIPRNSAKVSSCFPN